jgi:hypothetical protein
VAIFVLTSILKELQWQIRIETDQMVDQSEVLAIVRVVSVAQILADVLVAVLVVHVAMIAMRNRLVRLGRSALLITLTRRTQSQRLHQFLTKSTLLSCHCNFECS